MTESEAIEALTLEGGLEITGKGKRVADFFAGLDVAISALKEVQRYREIGTVEEFRKTADRNNQKQPVWKNGRSTIFKDYVDGHGEAEENKWADWVCPECGWFVGEQYLPRQHNQSKCNFCPKCGQAIRWEN